MGDEAIEAAVGAVLGQIDHTALGVVGRGLVAEAAERVQADGRLRALGPRVTEEDEAVPGVDRLFAAQPAVRGRAAAAVHRRARQEQVAAPALEGLWIEHQPRHATARARVVRGLADAGEAQRHLVVAGEHPALAGHVEAGHPVGADRHDASVAHAPAAALEDPVAEALAQIEHPRRIASKGPAPATRGHVPRVQPAMNGERGRGRRDHTGRQPHPPTALGLTAHAAQYGFRSRERQSV